MTRARRALKAFTLIELMITVVILGILAALAVVAYTKYIRSARTSEATASLGKIKTLQVAYFQEFGQFCDVSGNDTTYEPAGSPPAGTKVAWSVPAASTWNHLGFKPTAPVVFQYLTHAGLPGSATFPAALNLDSTRHWFYARARGDQNGDGAVFSTFEITSESDLIFSKDEVE